MSTITTDRQTLERLGVDDLEELMRSVNDVTRQLEATHTQLRGEVARLQRELAEANAQLQRSKSLAALGEMAAGIAHEVRNPLGSIQLYSQMLGEDLADRPEQAELCSKISRAVEGLDSIVHDVMLFARDTRVDPSPTTAETLLERSLENCASLVASHEVTVDQPVRGKAGHAIELTVDGSLIVQALNNVIRNAVEAMADDSIKNRVLTLSAERASRRCPDGRRAERVVFTIEDTGPGIDEDVVNRMFNPFFTTRRSGTGLGLAIVHQIIDAHGGHVNVESNGDEGGSRFELCLPPVCQPQESAEGHQAEGLDQTVTRRIQTEHHA